MIDRIEKKNLLGVSISVTDYSKTVETILDAAGKSRALGVTTLDVHGLYRASRNAEFRKVISAVDIVTPDGHSVKWGLNMIYKAGLKDRVTGPDLMLLLCERAADANLPVYLYGSRDYVVTNLADVLKNQFSRLNIAGFRPSRFRPSTPEEEQDDINAILRSGAKITFVGLGCPLQENWVVVHVKKLNMPILSVGAAFDFHSGNKRRAPMWMQRFGLEWVFRIFVEPKRLGRRTLPAIIYFFWGILGQRFGLWFRS